MSFIARAPFAFAAALAATATVAAATPAFAAPASSTALVLVSVKSGGATGAQRYCLAKAGDKRAVTCRTEREWAKRRILLRLV